MNADPKIKLLTEQFLILKKEIGFLVEENKTNYNYLQNYLYFFYIPLFNYVESIILLCEHKKYISASVILRSLIEAHINIIYHQTSDSERKLAILAKSGFDKKIKEIKKIKGLIEKYPNLESKDPSNLFSHEDLKALENVNKNNLQAVLKGNNIKDNDCELNLYDKAIKCDGEQVKNAEGGHFEKMYIINYGYLCSSAHLDLDGLQAFITEKQDEKSGEHLIFEAIDICTAYTKDLYENNVISGKIPENVANIENLLKDKRQELN